MKFRILSIFAGIGQGIALFVFLEFLITFLDRWFNGWSSGGGNGVVIVLLLSVFLVLLPYPLYLIHKHQIVDGLLTLVVSILAFGGFSLFWLQQMFGGMS